MKQFFLKTLYLFIHVALAFTMLWAKTEFYIFLFERAPIVTYFVAPMTYLAWLFYIFAGAALIISDELRCDLFKGDL